MKKSNSFLSITLMSLVAAFAVSASAALAPATADLKATMKDMAKTVLQIVMNSNDPSKDAASAALCDHLLGDIATARGLTPPKIQALPAAQQSGQMALYQQAMDKLTAAVSQMKTDFLNGNNSAVQQDLSQIQAIKTDGHNEFKGN